MISYIKNTLHKIHIRLLDLFRKQIHKYEFGKVLNLKICDTISGEPISELPVGVFCPVMVVSKTLENYFGFYGYLRLKIHGIDVDTQNEDAIEVTIRIHRPGMLIGKGGKDINAVEKLLTDYFCKRVIIHISEVRQDINERYCTDWY
jgi:predicted RNA-binding protein YlqC (UPF0109 family)